jgi:hypothetical protein
VKLATQFDSPHVADPLHPAEVRQLWWFLDGAIMHADTRMELRRGWGLCPRHAWAMALVEVELRGGVPFATTVLYSDLAGGAVGVFGSRHLRSPIRLLESRGRCPTCEYAEHAADEPQEWRERAAAVNRRSRFSALLADGWEEAVIHSCPACAGGDGPPCRPHLLAGAEPPADLATRLRRLRIAMHAYEKSLTVDGRPVDHRGRQAWLHTLGWFAGWRFPAELRPRGGHGDRIPAGAARAG